MGKIRRSRTKLHAPAAQIRPAGRPGRTGVSGVSQGHGAADKAEDPLASVGVPSWAPQLSLFPGIPARSAQSSPPRTAAGTNQNVVLGSPDTYVVPGPPTDRATAAMDDAPGLTLKLGAEKPTSLRKEDKRKQRRERFLNKLDAIHAHERKKKELARKKANPPALVGDLTTLHAELDALRDTAPTGRKARGSERKQPKDEVRQAVVSRARRRHALAVESKNLQAVLQHPQFKINAAATIKEHIKNSLAAERKAKAQASRAKQQDAKPQKAQNKGRGKGKEVYQKISAAPVHRERGRLGKGGRLGKRPAKKRDG